MSISSIGQQGPVSPVNTNAQVQGGNQQPAQSAKGDLTNTAAKSAGTQPLNPAGRGQLVNIIV